MGLMQEQNAESAVETMRADFQERMEATLKERAGAAMVQIRVTRNFFSLINGFVGEEKVLAVPFYRHLLATVQADDPTGTPRYWEVLNAMAPEPGALATAPDADTLTGEVPPPPAAGADLPGAPPADAPLDDPIGPPPTMPEPVAEPDPPIGPPDVAPAKAGKHGRR